MVKILKVDEFQEGQDVIACRYDSARKAIIGITKNLFE